MKKDIVSSVNARLPIKFLARFPKAFSICALLIQNWAIFCNHYCGRSFFGCDFFRTYYAMVAFWTTAIKAGLFPQWLPFQSCGYPFHLAVQSGFFYPPFWIFALSKALPYSVYAAVTVQCLHVAFGAIGCFLFIELLTESIPIGLLSGFAFQFFGGFYSNAEHPDIVRAYAWLPWLFYSSYICAKQSKLEVRNWLLPLVLYCFVTGTYQGNLFSQLAFLFGILGLHFLEYWGQKRKSQRESRRHSQTIQIYIQVILLIGLGMLLSSIYLVPVLFTKQFMARSVEFVSIGKFNWTPRFWPTLFMGWNNERYAVDISMISAFITVPIVCLYGLINLAVLRKYWIWFFALFLSFALAAGSTSPVYNQLVRFFPLFSLSRFPTSDYRGLVGFLGIVIASLLLKDFLLTPNRNRLVLKLMMVPLLVVIGYLSSLFPVRYIARENICAALIALLSISALCLLRKSKKWLLFALMGLTLISGFYITKCISWETWNYKGDLENWYQTEYHVNTLKPLPIADRLQHPPATRPPRKDTHDFDWKGFLTGDYTYQLVHYGLQQRMAITQYPALLDYMQEGWKPFYTSSLEDINCSTGLPRRPLTGIQVNQSSYGMNEIHYSVRAGSDFILVENELSFPGWIADAPILGKPIQAVAVCGGLRGWKLVKGEYELTARFKMPYFNIGMALSIIALTIYLPLWRTKAS